MTDQSSPAITAVDVRKSFGDNVVLDGLELAVEQGSVFALLGPNGAGKTTMVRILATLLEADHGTIRVAGHDVRREPDAVRDAIGVTGQFSAIDELLTGRENLALMADLHHLSRAPARERIDELLEQFELADAADRIAMTYSGGMRRRLDLAMTLIGAPQVIFLDEPTTGLDPRSRRTVWEIVGSLVDDGTTVFLTTQYLDEADKLADRVAILDRGRLVAEGSAQELKQRIPGGRIDVRFADAEAQLVAGDAWDCRSPTRTRRACKSPPTATSPPCVACSATLMRPVSTLSISRFTPPISTTCSSRSRAVMLAPRRSRTEEEAYR